MLNATYNGYDSFNFSYEENGKTYSAQGRYDNNGVGNIVAASSGKDINMIQTQIHSLGQDQFQKLIRDVKASSQQMR